MTTSPPEAKKRKAVAAEDELQIDVGAPEPPSKKARRKAKKHRTKAIEPGDTGDESTAAAKSNGNDRTQDNNTTKTTPTKPPNPYSIWLGNLPFTITKPLLQRFLTTAPSPIPDTAITRIHLPAPHSSAVAAAASKSALKPMNKGFAYVDLADQSSFDAALALSETPLANRNILIKSAGDFSGRPAEHGGAAPKTGDADTQAQDGDGITARKGKGAAHDKTTPTRRVWIGNLGFGVTERDTRDLYEARGGLDVEDVKLATFEDSGKCKGFGWVVFAGLEGATAAVRGFVHVASDGGEGEKDEDGGDESEDEGGATKDAKGKKTKKEKVFVNRLQGRDIRREFAEDPTTRYNKRFGRNRQNQDETPDKNKEARGRRAGAGAAVEEREDGAGEKRRRREEWDATAQAGGDSGDAAKQGKDKYANDQFKYRTGGIVRSEGVKTNLS